MIVSVRVIARRMITVPVIVAVVRQIETDGRGVLTVGVVVLAVMAVVVLMAVGKTAGVIAERCWLQECGDGCRGDGCRDDGRGVRVSWE